MAETINRCLVHGSDMTADVFREGHGVCQYAWYSGHAVEACLSVERVLSVPGELVDPAKVDYEAATRVFADLTDIRVPTVAREATRRIVDAARGVEEPVEGNG